MRFDTFVIDFLKGDARSLLVERSDDDVDDAFVGFFKFWSIYLETHTKIQVSIRLMGIVIMKVRWKKGDSHTDGSKTINGFNIQSRYIFVKKCVILKASTLQIGDLMVVCACV